MSEPRETLTLYGSPGVKSHYLSQKLLNFQTLICQDLYFSSQSFPTMSKNSKVLNLKDKISGNEVDLSLCNLTEVPVKELVSY